MAESVPTLAYTPKFDAKAGTPAWDSTGGYVNSPRDMVGSPDKLVRSSLSDDGDRDAAVVEAIARAIVMAQTGHHSRD